MAQRTHNPDSTAIRYQAAQYYHPAVYVSTIAVSFALAVVAMLILLAGGTLTPIVVLLGLSMFTLVSILALGRLVVTVDDRMLTLSYGWLGLRRRSIDLDTIEEMRVRLFNSLTAYLSARGRRGVVMSHEGRRYLVGSADPHDLKLAVSRSSAALDERPEYLRERFRLPRPRRTLGYLGWAHLHVAECTT